MEWREAAGGDFLVRVPDRLALDHLRRLLKFAMDDLAARGVTEVENVALYLDLRNGSGRLELTMPDGTPAEMRFAPAALKSPKAAA